MSGFFPAFATIDIVVIVDTLFDRHTEIEIIYSEYYRRVKEEN